MSHEINELHGEVLSALASSRLPHTAKAAILLQEAVTELRTGVTAGEFTSRLDARAAWREAAAYVAEQSNAA